jgi:hypothetical protein
MVTLSADIDSTIGNGTIGIDGGDKGLVGIHSRNFCFCDWPFVECLGISHGETKYFVDRRLWW